MNEKETRILDTFKKAFPLMTEPEKDNLLSYGEGMAAIAKTRKPKEVQQTVRARASV